MSTFMRITVIGLILQACGVVLVSGSRGQGKSVAAGCPAHLSEVRDGYTIVHNYMCYLFVDDEVYWDRARDECYALGGEMLIVEDEGTMDFIAKTLYSRELGWNRNGVWLGAHQRDNKWEWANGRELKYTNWDGEPSQVLGSWMTVENCVLMRREDGWRWHDNVCGSLRFHYNFICQFPLSKPSDEEAQVSPSATQETEDNGNSAVLVIILAVGMSLLVLIFIIAVLLFVYHRRTKQRRSPEIPPVHYSNGHYYNQQRENLGAASSNATTTTVININGGSNGTGSGHPLLESPSQSRYPMLPPERPPAPLPMQTSSGLPPGSGNDFYAEVIRLRPMPVSLPSPAKTSQHALTQPAAGSPQTGSSPSPPPRGSFSSSSTSPISSGSRLYPANPDIIPESAPLMTPSTSSDPLLEEESSTSVGLSETRGCGGPVSAALATTDYVDMSSLLSREAHFERARSDDSNTTAKGRTQAAEKPDEDKHTYTNVDHKDEKAENLYEVLP